MVAKADRMTTRHCNHHNYEPLAKHLNFVHMITGILQRYKCEKWSSSKDALITTVTESMHLSAGLLYLFKPGAIMKLAAVIKANVWNKIQPETIQKPLKKAGFVTTQEQDVAAPLDSSPPMKEFEVDFEGFVEMHDNMAICNEPDLEAIFQLVWTEVQSSRKVLEATDAEELSEELGEEDTKIVDIPKEEDASHLIRQLKSFAMEKCPGIVSDTASFESAFSVYLHKKNKKQTKIDFFSERMNRP